MESTLHSWGHLSTGGRRPIRGRVRVRVMVRVRVRVRVRGICPLGLGDHRVRFGFGVLAFMTRNVEMI